VLERLAQARGIDDVVVVEGAHRLTPVPGTSRDAVTERGPVPCDVPGTRVAPATPGTWTGARVIHCDDWARGPGASLRAGLAALPADATHAVVLLADGPTLDPRAVDRLIEHRGDGDVLAATYDGRRSHPVLLARAAWREIPDAGGRALDPTLVDCSDLEPPGDLDYPVPPGDVDYPSG
jgi:nicotine blue oxidoreductase